jgi:mono/diheme cytochrome c family protein
MIRHCSIDTGLRRQTRVGVRMRILLGPGSASATIIFVALMALHSTAAGVGGKLTKPAPATLRLNSARRATSDLEVGGELAGFPAGTTRFVLLDSLLALPSVTYIVTDDANLPGATRIRGVPLEELAGLLGAAPESDLVVAICDDKYRANYSRAYVAAHHPVLVLQVNGELPPRWPKDPETHQYDMGPYMVSHPKFTPSFKILAHTDQAQIPWGVVRLEFRPEKAVLGAIAPRGLHASDPGVQAGYRIAQQDCFRCHNMGREGGQKSGRPWPVLAAWAATSPEYFLAYVREPKQRNSQAEMPANPGYDNATISALRDYFATFAPREKP